MADDRMVYVRPARRVWKSEEEIGYKSMVINFRQ